MRFKIEKSFLVCFELCSCPFPIRNESGGEATKNADGVGAELAKLDAGAEGVTCLL